MKYTVHSSKTLNNGYIVYSLHLSYLFPNFEYVAVLPLGLSTSIIHYNMDFKRSCCVNAIMFKLSISIRSNINRIKYEKNSDKKSLIFD